MRRALTNLIDNAPCVLTLTMLKSRFTMKGLVFQRISWVEWRSPSFVPQSPHRWDRPWARDRGLDSRGSRRHADAEQLPRGRLEGGYRCGEMILLATRLLASAFQMI